MKRRVEVASEWGARIGYSRAVRAGNLVIVSGTSAGGPAGVSHKGDAEGQAELVLQRIGEALDAVGASLEDVVETRVFLRDMAEVAARSGSRAKKTEKDND